MKFSCSLIILCATLLVATIEGRNLEDQVVEEVVEEFEEADLLEKWAISVPVVEFFGDPYEGAVATSKLTLVYNVSDFILLENIETAIYTKGCKKGVSIDAADGVTMTSDNSGVSDISLLGSSSDVTFSSTAKSTKVDMIIDLNKIIGDERMFTTVLDEDGSSSSSAAKVEFCMRYVLKIDDPQSEVNFVESLVTFDIDLTAGINYGSLAVEAKEKDTDEQTKSYNIDAYLCDNPAVIPFQARTSAEDFRQGSLISVCIEPSSATKDDGLRLVSLDSFSWKRDGVADQEAIKDGIVSTNLLTGDFSCAPDGVGSCSFSSILVADFYSSSGIVTGEGITSLNFVRRSRSLIGDGEQRALQNTADDVADVATTSSAEFDISIGISNSEEDGPAALLQTAAAGVATTTLGVTGVISVLGLISTVLFV